MSLSLWLLPELVGTTLSRKMPCPSLPVSIWEDECGECGGCGASDVKVPVASSLDCRISSELQMVTAVKILLQGIGEDVEREGILKTPSRVAKAFQSFFSGYELTPEGIIGGALFTEVGTDGGTGGGSGGMVVVRKIDSFALCDTCLLPFRLRCHVAYIPSGQRVVGLSKLPRVVNMLSRRLQNPQKLANQLVQALYDTFEPLGVAAAVESWHLEWPGFCEKNGGPLRGCAEDRLGYGWVPTTVYAAHGEFGNVQSSLWDEFIGIVELDGIEIRRPTLGTTNALPGKEKSCPFFSYSGKVECRASVSAIALAVESLLRAEGERVSREELQLTASRYVNWILSATQGSNQKLLNGTVIDVDLQGSVNVPAGHSNGNGCCNHPWLTSDVDVHHASAVGLVNNHHSYNNGVVYGVTNGISNGHSNGVHYGGTNGTVNGYSSGISHGLTNGIVSAAQRIDEHTNSVHHGITNGTVNGYSNAISHGVRHGTVSALQSIGKHSNGVHRGITSETVSGYNNGINHGVSNGAVNGGQSYGERCHGVHHGVPDGAVSVCGNVINHGVSNVPSSAEHCNGVHYGVQNGAVIDCSSGMSHGVTNGTIKGYSNSINHGVANEGVNGYTNGISHGVSNGPVSGVQNVGEKANGSVPLGMTLSSDLNDHAEGLFSLELDLPLSSLCEHHLLPFFGVAHLGYVGGRFRLERSLVLKIVRMFSRRLQVQERLTRQIAESIASLADFQWIMVVVEANHMCIMSRGAEKLGSTTATVATIGQLANEGAMRVAVLKRITRRVPKRTSS